MQVAAADYVVTHFANRNDNHLSGSRPDHRQVQASYASYTWILIVQLHVRLNLDNFG
jgi:hypothetical protein